LLYIVHVSPWQSYKKAFLQSKSFEVPFPFTGKHTFFRLHASRAYLFTTFEGRPTGLLHSFS
ncbi:hypothetical protein, partial [Streptococcus infantis]|uniref:hypothetical protein n=1 Tax=Streptococcus infantis TaxID=68892 RepID=UPI001CBE23DD